MPLAVFEGETFSGHHGCRGGLHFVAIIRMQALPPPLKTHDLDGGETQKPLDVIAGEEWNYLLAFNFMPVQRHGTQCERAR